MIDQEIPGEPISSKGTGLSRKIVLISFGYNSFIIISGFCKALPAVLTDGMAAIIFIGYVSFSFQIPGMVSFIFKFL